MKKKVSETRTFCDFCDEGKEQEAHKRCLVCDRDICDDHTLDLDVRVAHQSPGFSAHLCPVDALPLEPALTKLAEAKGDWGSIGHNPEYNQARLKEIRNFLVAAQVFKPKEV